MFWNVLAAAAAAGTALGTAAMVHPAATDRSTIPAVVSRGIDTPDAGGNISVYVPPAPPYSALRGLCQAFLAGSRDHEIQILIGATGGTAESTTKWCEAFLR